MSPLRWGVLGAGYVAGTFCRTARSVGVQLGAVGSRDPERGQVFAERYQIPTVHGSYADLVSDPLVDAVYVATPHALHEEHALLALDAGKHVLVEKPIALNADQAARIHRRAEERGLVALDGLWSRYLPMMGRIRELVSDGAIGELVTVYADHSQALTDDPLHRINNLALGGGALLDLGVYAVSFVVDLLGPPTEVAATGTLKPTGADSQATVTLRNAGGVAGIVHTTSTAAGANTAFVLGRRGRIDIARTFYAPSSFVVSDHSGDPVEVFRSPDPSTGFAHQMYEMQRLVDAGERISPCLTPAASLEIMRVLDTARRQLGVVYPAEHGRGGE